MSPRVSSTLVAAVVAATASTAVAAPPTGGTFAGTVSGKKVTLTVAGASGKLAIDCGKQGGKVPAFRVAIASDGTFSGKAGGAGRPPYASVKGSFQDKRTAKVNLTLIVCDGRGGKGILRKT